MDNAKKSPSRSRKTESTFALVPPHDEKIEQAVLGALLLEGQLYHELSGRLTSDMFYDERHGVIFGAIEYLAAHGQPVDLYTVGRRLEESQMLE